MKSSNIDKSKNVLQRSLENVHGPFASFVHAQTTSSLVLLIATCVALWWANSAYSGTYQNLTHIQLGFVLGEYELKASLKHIINDGLMVVFFFLLGLEIKREVLAGDLALSENRRMLILCAMGGMAVPAIIFSLFNWSLDSQSGWGIPMATDTAFALGVLSLIKKRIPLALITFIVGLAIVDDVGAIVVIALFYTQQISIFYLLVACCLIGFLALSNYAGVRQLFFYLVVGVVTWWAMLKSGIHPTFAGVAIALTVPARPGASPAKLMDRAKSKINLFQQKEKPVDMLGNREQHNQVLEIRDVAEHASTPLRRWEDALELPVALLILPLFALVNAGIVINLDLFIESLKHSLGLGIISGLVLGKFIGISGACWLALRLNIGRLPEAVSLQHVVGVSLIAGIGFTMSTFIATLGFDAQPDYLHTAKTSILFASLVSAILGLMYLRFVAEDN